MLAVHNGQGFGGGAKPSASPEEHWPGYQNGVNLGGGFVIENWMSLGWKGFSHTMQQRIFKKESYSK